MMKFVTFTEEHIDAARALAAAEYEAERFAVPALPADCEVPRLRYFAKNSFGLAALEEDRLVGFLCYVEPWEGGFDTFDTLSTFSPAGAHGAVKENRARIYQDMYAHLAEQLAAQNVLVLGVSLYAHDEEAKQALFEYGFGMRCKDRILRIDDALKAVPFDAPGAVFEELPVEEFPRIRDLRCALNDHLKQSPCFMQSTSEEYEGWIANVEKGDRRTFIAKKDGRITAYLDVAEEGENFVTIHEKMMNLQGAYCVPECRGDGTITALLHYVLSVLKEEGNEYLGVDHESYNPTANRFWNKYFAEYTNSVVRYTENWSVGK